MDAVSPPVNKIQWYEKPLIMPLRDIIKEYREAKNPKKQVDILADLNHTKSCRIAWLLDRCGEDVDKVKLPRRSQRDGAPDLDMIWRDTPLGAEAVQINMERKHRIMEEKKMYIKADAECPVETEENSLAWVEKALESEVLAEECPKNEDVVKEMALPKGKKAEIDGMTLYQKGFLEFPPVMDDHKTNVSPNYQYDVTAQLWDVYLSRRRSVKALDTNDVRLMLKLAEVAREMAL